MPSQESFTPKYDALAAAASAGRWRWQQFDNAVERDVQTLQIENIDLVGILALSADGQEWHFFVPDGDRLVLVPTEAEARERRALFPANGLVHLPESMYVRFFRLHYYSGTILGLVTPLDPENLPAWSGVPAFSGAYAAPATEATMREILAELKKLNVNRFAG